MIFDCPDQRQETKNDSFHNVVGSKLSQQFALIGFYEQLH